ncbi:MAG TPA: hypothetical protein VEI97_11560, partial [bacterium]|nr:hypothetical protein [bacterium]
TPIQSITYQTVSITVTEPVTPPAEVLVVTAAYGEGHPLAGQTQLVQVLPSKVPVPNTLGTDLGAVNSDLFPNNPLRALYIDTLGDTNTIDVPSGSGKIGIGAFKGVHPGIAPGAVAGIPATQPFVFIRGDLGSPALWIADAIDGGLWQALPPGPRPLPGLTLMGETLYADMAGPDWNPGNGTQIAASLGTGITVQSGLPPVLANGDIYRYDIANPLTAPTKVTNARTNNTQGFFYPDWHPTENRAVCLHVETILFIPYFRLSTINMASGASTNLNLSGMGSPPAPATSYIPITPVYNRDGSKIAFAALEVDLAAGEIYDADVWVYTVSGGAVTNVTNTNDVFEGYPAFN